MEKVPLAQETGADLLVTNCPACKRNLELAAKRKKTGYKVKDLVEVVAQSMGL
jgi:Fe-S oxidoreductase